MSNLGSVARHQPRNPRSGLACMIGPWLSQSSHAAVLWVGTNGCRLVGLGRERRAHVTVGSVGRPRHLVASGM